MTRLRTAANPEPAADGDRKGAVPPLTAGVGRTSRGCLPRIGAAACGVDVHVRDDQASDGRIDILARDTRGYHVVIELKRHRSASREGLQELAKYVRLLAEQSGLSTSRIRCFLVSLDWNALHAPFAVLKPVFPCSLTGYTYTIGSDGIPRNFEPVLSRAPASVLSLATQHFMIAVEGERAAEAELQRATTVFGKIGIEDYVAFVFDRREPNPPPDGWRHR